MSPVISAEVAPDSKATLRRIGISVALGIAVAAAEIIAASLPAVADAATAFLPVWLALGAKPAALTLAGLLLKQAAKYHTESVVSALKVSPEDLPTQSDPGLKALLKKTY